MIVSELTSLRERPRGPLDQTCVAKPMEAALVHTNRLESPSLSRDLTEQMTAYGRCKESRVLLWLGWSVFLSHPLQTISSLCCHRRTASSALIRLQEFSGQESVSWKTCTDRHPTGLCFFGSSHWNYKLKEFESQSDIFFCVSNHPDGNLLPVGGALLWCSALCLHPCDSGGGSCFPGQISKHS